MDLTEPVLLTPEGLEKLKRDLDVALGRRVEAGERLKEAFQPGDIEDNPEYEQAKEEVGLLDGRIYELQEMIGHWSITAMAMGPGRSRPGRICSGTFLRSPPDCSTRASGTARA